MHLQARRLALSGMLCALASVFLLLGGFVPVMVYAAPLLAILTLVPVREECGRRLFLAAYGATALLGLILCPDRELAIVFVFLGWYPAAQPALDRIGPAAVRIIAKLALFCCAAAGAYGALLFLFGAEELAREFSGFSLAAFVLMAVLSCVTFLLADLLVSRAAAAWRRKLRRRWFR
ncbi:MAG: hypothetical protein LKJ80_00145 [Oscillibacter sp.]|nr:hypothetical protein [Oscillibacter sp.]